MLRQYTPTPVRSAVNPVVYCGQDVAATLNDSSRETVIWDFFAHVLPVFQLMCDFNFNWIVSVSLDFLFKWDCAHLGNELDNKDDWPPESTKTNVSIAT
jgi:hypothetical protein